MIGESENALIQKIQTTTDGGFRLTLDFIAGDAELIAKLMAYKALGAQVLKVSFDAEAK